ncbi:3-phosphoshikimate 1-carboxyvinyltransferase [Chloroflexota bacterium]
MVVSVDTSEVSGKVKIPTSKSYTIRALMCAALAKGESEIINPLISDDTEVAIDVLSKIGVGIRKEDNLWRVSGGNLHAPDMELFCGESAATLRFMTAVCAIIPGKCTLTAGPTLTRRPVKILVDALRKLGVKGSCKGDAPPVIVEGGSLEGGLTSLPGNVSSQFISALLLVAPFAKKGVRIRLNSLLESRFYVVMTLRCQRRFGIKVSKDRDKFAVNRQKYQPAKYKIEGDWSTASYFLALGALSGELEVENLNSASWQGDRVVIDFLRDMGAQVRFAGNSIIVKKAENLKAIKTNLSDCIDLLPTMAILAAVAEGTSEFTGIKRARQKESNRVAAVRDGLRKMGIEVREEMDKLTIVGSKQKEAEAEEEEKEEEEEEEDGKEDGKEDEDMEKADVTEQDPPSTPIIAIDSKNDHRIAMAFGTLGLVVGGITIEGAECVSKTYPQFWDVLKSIGGKVKIDGE